MNNEKNNQDVNENVNLSQEIQLSNQSNQNLPLSQHETNALLSNQANNLEFGEEIRKMLSTAGTLELNERQIDILYRPVQDNEVSIKPDGLIYLSWIKYSDRLTKAFTGTGWAMLPQGMPKIHKNLVIWGFHLVIKGVYCGFAIGEQEFFDNGRMSFGEACEGAKSNALMRLCKAIGIGLELWDKVFIDRWVGTYADKKWNEEKRKYMWFLKQNAFGQSQSQNNVQNTQRPQNTSVQNNVQNTQNTQNTPPSAPAPLKTPTETIKTGIGNGGNVGKGKLPENSDFLGQTEKSEIKETKSETKSKGKKVTINKSSENVPMEEITEKDLAPDNAISQQQVLNFKNFIALVSTSETTGDLKTNYNIKVKKALSDGHITEEQKEELRVLANKKFVELSSLGK